MNKWIFGAIGLTVAILIGVIAYFWTPAPKGFDAVAAIERARDFNARIVRDQFGVPHIYGAKDADVAFGLGYAHAEDDWETFEEVLFFSRGELARHRGRDGAIPDFLVRALNVEADISENYAADLSVELRDLVEAYASGVNLFCAENRTRCAKGSVPVSGQDIIAGFVSRTPFFYGLDEQLTKLFEGDVALEAAAEKTRGAFLHIPVGVELGSNAMAIAPQRSADGHTRLMVNSHQPYEGPVAWYEARVKSEEGWDMIGGVFPGAPMILHGAGPALGWAHTVNKPDLVDFFKLEVDDEKSPTKYKLDGKWRRLETSKIVFRVRLFWRFSLPVTRKIYRSVHGPAFITDKGVFAVSYAGAGDIRAAEQWFRMNKADSFETWRDAMAMGAIPSFNVVYADGEGNIAYFYNAALPIRSADHDWSVAAPGNQSTLTWQGVRPFNAVPKVINPISGYVVNANNTPFAASALGDNPDPADYPRHFGVQDNTTNRGLRLQSLYGADQTITEEEFLVYKFDHLYTDGSRIMSITKALATDAAASDDPLLQEAAKTLGAWNGSADRTSRGAALAILTAQKVHGYILNQEEESREGSLAALRETASALNEGFGRIDPEWGEVMRFRRGKVDAPIDGGPDTLRAVYGLGDPAEGPLTAAFGDTHMVYADWSGPGDVKIQTIHQFGSATLDETSPHYDDQAELFVNEHWRSPPMQLETLLAEATADYRPGKSKRGNVDHTTTVR